MYEILSKKILSATIKEINVKTPELARKARAGQFVVVRVHEKGERIPLTIADYNREEGWITLVYQEIGKSTIQLGTLEAGDTLAGLTGPLGHPTDTRNRGRVICIGGGVGIAPIYPIARALKEAGNEVISIIGARNKELLFWEEKMRAVSHSLHICTDDGSHGEKGVVTQPLEELLRKGQPPVAHTWAIGPVVMMKFCALTAGKYNAPVTVSLNTIMVDGTGMCGACRVKTDTGTFFACVDGPEFDGRTVDWNNLIARQQQYKNEETRAIEHHECRCARKETENE